MNPRHYLSVLIILLIPVLAYSQEPSSVYKNLKDFKISTGRDYFNVKSINANGDGIEDYLLQDTYGEEIFQITLLSGEFGYIAVDIPAGKNYRTLKTNQGFVIEVTLGTFPDYGSLYGSDKYHWYDYYLIERQSLRLVNESFIATYERMIPLYRKRITELEIKITQLLNEDKSTDRSVLEAMARFRQAQIMRYKEFIKKAQGIIQMSSKRTLQ